MKTIGIIAEYNPFHNGHLHLIESCKKALEADFVVVVMSGDFVQRGTPSFIDKFTRTKMALECGADIVFELPIYYSTGSAEFFAQGAVSLLDKLGCVDYLCFGSESADISLLSEVADILVKEPSSYKKSISSQLKSGISFAKARQNALLEYISAENLSFSKNAVTSALSSPNNILGIEYIKAIKKLKSAIIPYSIKRIGQDYNSDTFSEFSSASAIRSFISNGGKYSDLSITMPKSCVSLIKDNQDRISNYNKFSEMVHYKLLLEKGNGYTRFLDVSRYLSNKISSSLEKYKDFDSFCELLKSKDLTYSRISRSLLHVFLNITTDNMDEYRSHGFTAPARVLGMRKSASSLVKEINKAGHASLFTNLKTASSVCTDIELRLLNETLLSSEVYGCLCQSGPINEYRQKQIIF